MSIRFDLPFIQEVISGVVFYARVVPDDVRFSIDSRTLQPGDIYIALPGAKIDGHAFVKDALAKGAGGLIIAADKKDCLTQLDAQLLAKKLVLLVPDTLQALTQLAVAWRAKFDCPVIGITGSVGKTSTKEMLANILTLNGNNFLVTQGNQNTKIGVSLNILKMRPEHQMVILELGISQRAEMAELAFIARPTTAIITAIAHCHMEGLGSLQGIALEKRDIFKYFSEKNIGMVNGDCSLLAQVSYNHPVVKFGSKTTNQIQARKININSTSVSFILKIYREKFAVTLGRPHTGIVYNALGATAVAHLLGVPHHIILQGIQQPLHVAGRFEPMPLKHAMGIIINDAYNANPESMKAALLALQHMQTNAHKIAVLGDMLELGVNSPFWHRQLGRFLRKVPSLKQVILVGDMVKWMKKTAPAGLSVEIVPNWQAAVETLQHQLSEESVVLVKGSNGVGLRNLVDAFIQKQESI